MTTIGIVGSGAWGTALGISLAGTGARVALWGRNTEEIAVARHNTLYLPDIEFPDSLIVVHHLEALRGCDTVLVTVPAQTVREICAMLRGHLEPSSRIVICAKGMERGSGKRLSEITAEELPENPPAAVLSGPSFAREVAQGKPTAVTLAAYDADEAAALAASLSNNALRIYHSTDVAGVELAGALKNVIAIACGIVIGNGLGENARAALMTRGLAEIARLATQLGARPETMMGLSGLGDLALTCGSLQSRNFSMGWQIGQGVIAAEAAAGTLVEGAGTAEAVLTLAAHHEMEMPVASTVHAILSGAMSIKQAIPALMTRPLKMEAD